MDGSSSLDGCFVRVFVQTCCHLLYEVLCDFNDFDSCLILHHN